MDAMILLVLLTLKGEGGLPKVNFVAFPDVPACEKKAEKLSTILGKAGYRVLERACVMGIQHFTPHRHRKTKGDKGKARTSKAKHLYLVALTDERVLAMPRHDRKACMEEAIERGKKSGGKVRTYCAVSDQALIDDREYEIRKRREMRRRYYEEQRKKKAAPGQP